jgi:hypothetical protein
MMRFRYCGIDESRAGFVKQKGGGKKVPSFIKQKVASSSKDESMPTVGKCGQPAVTSCYIQSNTENSLFKLVSTHAILTTGIKRAFKGTLTRKSISNKHFGGMAWAFNMNRKKDEPGPGIKLICGPGQ